MEVGREAEGEMSVLCSLPAAAVPSLSSSREKIRRRESIPTAMRPVYSQQARQDTTLQESDGSSIISAAIRFWLGMEPRGTEAIRIRIGLSADSPLHLK